MYKLRVMIAEILLIIVGWTNADTTMTTVDSIYDAAIELLVHQEYTAAQQLLSTTILNDETDIRSLYLSFAIEQTRILDYESYYADHKRFKLYADSIRPIFEKRIRSLHGRDSTECLFYIANIYGGISLMQLKTGNWFEGGKNALTLVNMLKQVKKDAPDFYAADLGLGAFNYYLGTSLGWIPFIDGNEQDGLDAIRRAVDADPPYNYGAKNSLCWILIERKEFKSADSIVQTMLKQYPENTIFLRIQALIALWTGKYDTAVGTGTCLIKLSEKRQPVNWSDLVAGYMVVVKSTADQGKPKEACRLAQEMLHRKIPPVYRDFPQIRKNMKIIRDIEQKCKRER